MNARGTYVDKKVLTLLTALLIALSLGACGKVVPLNPEGELGDAVVGDGGTRTDGSDLGSIYAVTILAEPAGSGSIPGWNAGEYPFSDKNGRLSIGQTGTDRLTPFYFTYTYPPNNFKLANAHLLIDTERDSSDTEGIFVDGVFSGYPANQNNSSPHIIHNLHGSAGGSGENTYFNDYSVAHYAQAEVNTFDLDVAKLLEPSPITIVDALSDGQLNVVTGDDSPVFQANLILNGYTISKTPLTCANSPTKTFENIYLHNDGNSIGSAAFSGTVESPFESVSSGEAGFKSIEFFFDPALPSVGEDALTLTSARITMTVRRNTDPVAIVVNGVGVSQGAFNRASATAEVESWNDGATATNYLTTFLSGIPTNETDTAVTLNLVSMLGASQTLTLLRQGKLNIALAGGIRRVNASNSTANRTRGSAVSGPQLDLDGTYYVKVCQVPNNPDSPLSDDNPIPNGGLDETSPSVSSLQADQITSSSAVIQWLTNEGATSQVLYGIGETDMDTPEDGTFKTFHSVTLTGLQPYKYYYYKVVTKDAAGNETVTGTKVFRTLR